MDLLPSNASPASATLTLPTTRLLSTPQVQQFEKSPLTLALIRHGQARSSGSPETPWIDTGLAPANQNSVVQCWQSSTAVTRQKVGTFTIHQAQQFAMVAATAPAKGDPAVQAERLYGELHQVSVKLDMTNIWRIWQYLPDITGPSGVENRYQRYCAGRRRAIALAGWKDSQLPAACLLGDQGDDILLYALIGRSPGISIENPRQVSAFQYPARYSKASPAFSRAVAVTDKPSQSLYVSGTSSITGHASRHTSVLDQLAETFDNLRSLLEESSRYCVEARKGIEALQPLKIYIRHLTDYSPIRNWMTQELPAGHPILYLRGDVCREELLVEVEGEITPFKGSGL